MLNRVLIKAEAKEWIRRGKASPILVSAIVVVLIFVMGQIDLWLDPNQVTYEQLLEMQAALEAGEMYELPASEPLSLPTMFVSVLIMLVTTLLTAGYKSYCMGIRRGEVMPCSSLLSGLSIAGQVIWCEILMSIRIFLWSMLFVIPGIIAAYRYRFAMYNIIRDPSLSASQAIALSCAQTRGMKLDLFVLDLTFFGWQLLSALTLGILDIWVLPYVTFTELGYYEEAQRRMGDFSEPTPKYQGPEF